MERTDEYFHKMFNDFWLFVFIILGNRIYILSNYNLGLLSIATYNICGVTVTKNISGMARSVVDVVRTVIIWTIGIIVTKTTNGARNWENLERNSILL